jgi:GntR family phosphonate transport system transcriptional regulator
MGVHDYFRRSTRVTARMPTVDEARLLQQPVAVPVIESANVNVDANQAAIDYTVVVYASQRVELVVDT